MTSARILPRSRNAGRSVRKAFVEMKAKAPRGPSVSTVIVGEMLSRYTKPTTEVITPPTSWTRPVPTRFRTPLTSSMMRDTRSPERVLSKTRTGRLRTCRCTWVRRSAMRCCASTLSLMVSVYEVAACTTTASATAPRSRKSPGRSPVGITSSMRGRVAMGRTSPARRFIRMSTRPNSTSVRRGQMISWNACLRLAPEIRFFFALSSATGPSPDSRPLG